VEKAATGIHGQTVIHTQAAVGVQPHPVKQRLPQAVQVAVEEDQLVATALFLVR
jgi:hypothetical protein